MLKIKNCLVVIQLVVIHVLIFGFILDQAILFLFIFFTNF